MLEVGEAPVAGAEVVQGEAASDRLQPPGELARRILRKEYPRKSLQVPLSIVTSDDVKVGSTVFPDQPDSFFDDFTSGAGPNSLVDICVGAALDGTACNGTLTVNLPKVA